MSELVFTSDGCPDGISECPQNDPSTHPLKYAAALEPHTLTAPPPWPFPVPNALLRVNTHWLHTQ
jgi:hypothetical protein